MILGTLWLMNLYGHDSDKFVRASTCDWCGDQKRSTVGSISCGNTFMTDTCIAWVCSRAIPPCIYYSGQWATPYALWIGPKARFIWAFKFFHHINELLKKYFNKNGSGKILFRLSYGKWIIFGSFLSNFFLQLIWILEIWFNG